MGLFGIFPIIIAVYYLIKEACEKPIPLENFANKDLMNQDKKKGISDEELWRNIRKGKYILKETYSPPPRDKYGDIVIQNNILYEQDCKKYGWVEARHWAIQGKYNLSEEELEAEKHREHKKYKEVYIITKGRF